MNELSVETREKQVSGRTRYSINCQIWRGIKDKVKESFPERHCEECGEMLVLNNRVAYYEVDRNNPVFEVWEGCPDFYGCVFRTESRWFCKEGNEVEK